MNRRIHINDFGRSVSIDTFHSIENLKIISQFSDEQQRKGL